MNRIGEYILVCLSFVVAAVFEFALVILANRNATLKTNSEDDLGKGNDATKTMIMKATTKIHPTCKKGKKNKEFKITVPPSYVFDSVAFFIHLLCFVIYNLKYWNENLN